MLKIDLHSFISTLVSIQKHASVLICRDTFMDVWDLINAASISLLVFCNSLSNSINMFSYGVIERKAVDV